MEAVSMPTSNEVGKAEECYRLANEAKTETDRLAYLDLACTWLEAASRQDEMTREQPKAERPKPKTRPGWRQRVSGFFR
jgi:hypothetical protein